VSGKVGQGGLKVLPLMTSLTKNPQPLKQKIFFRVQTRRLSPSFETFTGSVEHTGEIPAQSHMRLGVFFSENP